MPSDSVIDLGLPLLQRVEMRAYSPGGRRDRGTVHGRWFVPLVGWRYDVLLDGATKMTQDAPADQIEALPEKAPAIWMPWEKWSPTAERIRKAAA